MNQRTGPRDPLIALMIEEGEGGATATQATAPYQILNPAKRTLPLVLSSPHSGRRYSPDFLAAARLDAHAIRRSEDAFVDILFAGAIGEGAPMIRALFPRAFVDVNREAFEMDPEMFRDPLPGYVNTSSRRVRAGLGTIARQVGDGLEIYQDKLVFADALQRINQLYRPYHAGLAQMINETCGIFGHCILLDCHSMPSVNYKGQKASRPSEADIVLGDCHGRACMPRLIEIAEQILGRSGYSVVRNVPYSGGHTTQHYGRPERGVHALQIEIMRALYMDEESLVPHQGLAKVAADMAQLVRALGQLFPTQVPLF